MLLVLSPAKSLDFETPPVTEEYTLPERLKESAKLIQVLRKKSVAQVASLMDLSEALATLNVQRYKRWSTPFTPENAKQAVLAFNGDVYEGLDAPSLGPKALAFAQAHLRILSGLHGLLRPLDLIQPYRLEMGTRLATSKAKDLYAFWGDTLTEELNAALADVRNPVLINLASGEYFKAIRPKRLEARIITPVFEEVKQGQAKVVSFYAKRARGLMARHVIRHRLKDPEGLKAFSAEGYAFAPRASDASTWVFRREASGPAAAG